MLTTWSVRSDRGAGARAAAAWLAARGLAPAAPPWEVAITIDVELRPTPGEWVATSLAIAIDHRGWGLRFTHDRRESAIRVADVPAVDGRDDFALLDGMPPLRSLGLLVQALERAHGITFRRSHAAVRSTLRGADAAVLAWVVRAL